MLVYDEEDQQQKKIQKLTITPPKIQQQQTQISNLTIIQTNAIRVRSQQNNYDQKINILKQDLSSFRTDVQQKMSQDIIFYQQQEEIHNIQVDQTNRKFLKHKTQEDIQQKQVFQSKSQFDYVNKKKIIPQQHKTEKYITVKADGSIMIAQLVPKNFTLNATIQIDRNFLGSIKRYRLQLEKQTILVSKKQTFKYYSSFLISRHPQYINKRTQYYVGKMQSNFLGTEFKIFYGSLQSLQAQINYQNNIIGIMGPRKFKVIKPNLQNISNKKHQRFQTLLQANQYSKLMQIQTAKPIQKNGKYRVQFQGKAKIPSAKNFVLEWLEQRVLIMCKIQQDKWLLQVRYPFSLLEAFCIGLSSLDSKILAN